ncbi:serine/threonine protein kinase [Allokutzneria sp. A3M-2-11 16]|uniref:serine/threonine-protein kinase n=1 Tax=Allokutzneria sp. A3M-2-11 16 TaxID=2962043 RepID=UPI0020B8D862|nr:serine/threonine-protein kinase [Allokutzneria sp. A3M-2-11 16]MCP3802796.1 serine/threonine protein kinase [Allokutzneria sp. A3M-2-11 16]
MPDPVNGTLFGRYRVSGLLGTGAFASVWRAEDDALDAPVAIKVLADNWARHLDVRERFVSEAKLLRLADSDRILRVLDIGELPDGRPYFVTVLADGGSLEDRIADGELTQDEALAVLVEVAEAVCVLHELDIVHRDLKPSNVLIHRDRVLLADLGLAKALAQGSGLTQVAGSPGYMAPEQARGGAVVDERTDVYGLGALAHRLLAGETVGESGTKLQGRLGRAVRRALQADPDRRWPSARAFADELRAVAGGEKALSRRSFVLPGVAAVSVLGLVAALFYWQQEPPVKPEAGSPTPVTAPPVDPALCRASDVRVFDNGDSFEPLEMTRKVMELYFASDKRQCKIFGRLQDVRFVRADGTVIPLRYGDGQGEPHEVEVGEGGWAAVNLGWSVDAKNGKPAIPARLEFRLPGTLDLVSFPWQKGPVGDFSQVEVGPVVMAAN